jgi:hypothetical protein
MRVLIDHGISDEVIQHREGLETMLRGRDQPPSKSLPPVPECIMSISKIDQFMHDNNYSFVFTFHDSTVEYMPNRHSSSKHLENVSILFRRDWTKHGYLHVAYRMTILMPNGGMHHYWVKSVGQLRKALKHWEQNYCPESVNAHLKLRPRNRKP